MKQFDKNSAKRNIEIKQNKNTYIKRLSISLSCLILVCAIILFAFAKFETSSEEYTLINGKMTDTSSGDLELAIKINNENASNMPENNGNYLLSKLECKDSDGDVNVTYDNNTWAITYILISKKTRCTYYFISKEEWNFAYTGDVQSFTVPKNGNYKVELWGAQGGSSYGGKGGYVSGQVNLSKDQLLYLYVGSEGGTAPSSSTGGAAGWNGGAKSANSTCSGCGNTIGAGGGGSTDVRVTNGAWNNFSSLKSRIMVAAGGGGAESSTATGGAGGGLNGYNGVGRSGSSGVAGYGIGGKQNATSSCSSSYAVSTNCTSSFGYANSTSANTNPGGGGGGGYYGGGSSPTGNMGYAGGGGGGGSSFISGHDGCNAIAESSTSSSITHTGQSVHYSGLSFTNTKMIDGTGYAWTNAKGSLEAMPNPDGGTYDSGKGRPGNGYAKITYLGNN